MVIGICRSNRDLGISLALSLHAMLRGSVFRAPMVGLDIGTSGVKAVALRRGRARWALAAAAEMPMFPSTDEPAPIAAVSAAVRQVLDGLGLRRARVAAALPGHAVIVKRLSLPAMTREVLEDAIPWE